MSDSESVDLSFDERVERAKTRSEGDEGVRDLPYETRRVMYRKKGARKNMMKKQVMEIANDLNIEGKTDAQRVKHVAERLGVVYRGGKNIMTTYRNIVAARDLEDAKEYIRSSLPNEMQSEDDVLNLQRFLVYTKLEDKEPDLSGRKLTLSFYKDIIDREKTAQFLPEISSSDDEDEEVDTILIEEGIVEGHRKKPRPQPRPTTTKLGRLEVGEAAELEKVGAYEGVRGKILQRLGMDPAIRGIRMKKVRDFVTKSNYDEVVESSIKTKIYTKGAKKGLLLPPDQKLKGVGLGELGGQEITDEGVEYSRMKVADLEDLVDDRELELPDVGSGVGGKMIKSDYVKLLRDADFVPNTKRFSPRKLTRDEKKALEKYPVGSRVVFTGEAVVVEDIEDEDDDGAGVFARTRTEFKTVERNIDGTVIGTVEGSYLISSRGKEYVIPFGSVIRAKPSVGRKRVVLDEMMTDAIVTKKLRSNTLSPSEKDSLNKYLLTSLTQVFEDVAKGKGVYTLSKTLKETRSRITRLPWSADDTVISKKGGKWHVEWEFEGKKFSQMFDEESLARQFSKRSMYNTSFRDWVVKKRSAERVGEEEAIARTRVDRYVRQHSMEDPMAVVRGFMDRNPLPSNSRVDNIFKLDALGIKQVLDRAMSTDILDIYIRSKFDKTSLDDIDAEGTGWARSLGRVNRPVPGPAKFIARHMLDYIRNHPITERDRKRIQKTTAESLARERTSREVLSPTSEERKLFEITKLPQLVEKYRVLINTSPRDKDSEPLDRSVVDDVESYLQTVDANTDTAYDYLVRSSYALSFLSSSLRTHCKFFQEKIKGGDYRIDKLDALYSDNDDYLIARCLPELAMRVIGENAVNDSTAEKALGEYSKIRRAVVDDLISGYRYILSPSARKDPAPSLKDYDWNKVLQSVNESCGDSGYNADGTAKDLGDIVLCYTNGTFSCHTESEAYFDIVNNRNNPITGLPYPKIFIEEIERRKDFQALRDTLNLSSDDESE